MYEISPDPAVLQDEHVPVFVINKNKKNKKFSLADLHGWNCRKIGLIQKAFVTCRVWLGNGTANNEVKANYNELLEGKIQRNFLTFKLGLNCLPKKKKISGKIFFFHFQELVFQNNFYVGISTLHRLKRPGLLVKIFCKKIEFRPFLIESVKRIGKGPT